MPPELAEQYGHVPAAMAQAQVNSGKRGVAPEQVAATIEHALGARRMHSRYLVGRDARLMVLAKQLLPAPLNHPTKNLRLRRSTPPACRSSRSRRISTST